MIYTWYSFRDLVAYGRWFIAMNYSIHSIMYTYYVFRALRYRIPKWVAISITSLQLLQMVVGIFVNLVAAFQLYSGRGNECRVTYENIYFSFLLYFSFFILFFHYFLNTYMKKTKKDGDGKGSLFTNWLSLKSLKKTCPKLSHLEENDKTVIQSRARFIKALFKKVN